MGRELASLGFNLNFAPVLDIHTNPSNPVIGERAFGSTSEAVTEAALPFMRAMQAEGVIACGKHFPGHGDTSVDSHLGLPTQSSDLDALRQRELKPFAAAIAAGVPMIMTSHILYPNIDADAPVTLSRRFVTSILREELGFGGVTVSDDIGMGAMKGFFDSAEAAANFLAAGCDMLMVCAHFTEADRARGFAKAILAAAVEGRLDPALLAASRARIAALLAGAPNESGAGPSRRRLRGARAGGGALFGANRRGRLSLRTQDPQGRIASPGMRRAHAIFGRMPHTLVLPGGLQPRDESEEIGAETEAEPRVDFKNIRAVFMNLVVDATKAAEPDARQNPRKQVEIRTGTKS